MAGEKVRWNEASINIEKGSSTIVGDVLLSSGVIAYLGAFTGYYRLQVLNKWYRVFRENDLQFSSDFSLIKTLSDPVVARNWQMCGLPSDKISMENAIIINKSSRWPLIIDTQGQAINWIKNMESNNKLMVTNFQDNDFQRKLENAVRFGLPTVK